jgi:hypothetical protein
MHEMQDSETRLSITRCDDKERCTLRLSRELMDKLRDAVYWTPGLTLGSLAEQALRSCIEEIEEGRGEPFPRRTSNLRPGRPVKA